MKIFNEVFPERRLAGGGGRLVCLAAEDCQALTDHQRHGVEGRQQAGEEQRGRGKETGEIQILLLLLTSDVHLV